MPKFNIITLENWDHKVFYAVKAKTLEEAIAKIRAGELTHYDQRIGEVQGDCVLGVYEILQNGKPIEVPQHLQGEVAVVSEKLSPERRLADFWRSKARIEYSEFDRLIGDESPVHDKRQPVRQLSRQEPINFVLREKPDDLDTNNGEFLFDKIDLLCEYVARGLPLSRREYYMALAMGYIMGDRPYEDYFTNHWYETAHRCGHGRYEDNKDS